MQTTDASQTELQLNLLAQKGAAFYRRAAVSCHRHKALDYACRALWISPLLCLLLLVVPAVSLSTAVMLLIISIVALPVGVYVLSLLIVRLTTITTRKQSLALYDSQLALKDDLQIADEFYQIKAPTDFELAALAYCRSSVERAAKHELVPFPVRPHCFTTIQKIFSGLSLLASVLVVITALLRTELTAAPLGPPETGSSELQEITQTPLSSTIAAAEAERSSDPKSNNADQSQQVFSESKPEQAGKTAEADEAAETGSTSTSGGATAAKAVLGKAPMNDEQRVRFRQPPPLPPEMASENSQTDAGSQSDNSQAGPQQENQQASAANSNDNKSATTDSSSAQQDEQQREASQPAAAPSGPQQAQRSNKKQDSGKKNGQQQSSGSQQNSNSQNSNTQGDDAQKKSRGINQLMLAVPMEDQYIGTPGPGREKSVIEKQPSEEKPMATAGSASRGQTKQSAPVQQKPVTQFWEKQMLSNFFQQQHQNSQHNENANDN